MMILMGSKVRTYELLSLTIMQTLQQIVSEYDQEIHIYTLQTNPRHRDEESQNTNSHKTSGRQLK